MKSYFSRLLHHILSHSDVKPQSTDISSYSGLTRISRWKKFANLFDLDTPIKSECDTLEKSASTGRSMVEMLGVLAIIGVLSVGAIAGYSKAMTKYKLNKQAEQISSILDYVNIYLSDLKRTKSDTGEYLAPLFIKLGIIPQEMIRKNIANIIYDVFGNEIILHNYRTSDGTYIFEFVLYLNKGQKESCMNVFNIAKAKKEQLYRTKFETHKGDESAMLNIVYGDNYCSPNRKCLKDFALAEMENYCNICEDKDSCMFYYQLYLLF